MARDSKVDTDGRGKNRRGATMDETRKSKEMDGTGTRREGQKTTKEKRTRRDRTGEKVDRMRKGKERNGARMRRDGKKTAK